MPLQPWRNGVVTRIEQATDITKRFWISFPDLESFDFIPGQFVTMDLPIHEKPAKRLRSYSIASWPNGTNTIELLIVLLEGGLGTTYLFNEVAEGSVLTLRGPQGVFVLPSEVDTDLYFICTGTGIAPFRSMLYHIFLNKVLHRDIYLLFGTRTRKDLLYYEEMKDFESKIDRFHYLPTLSREQWEGHSGYVHDLYENLVQEKRTGPELPSAKFYLCGWKVMIDEAKQRLLNLGYDRQAIHQELYG